MPDALSLDVIARELDRYDAEESLAHFLRVGWRYIDPAPFVDGWVIDALAEHLQAVCDGEIRNLVINIPPRSLKSTLASVSFPAWVWAQRYDTHTSGPGVKFLHASYADKLSVRDSVRCRRIIESKWYQGLWGDRFSLSRDQNAKHRFSNDKGGERLITSIGAGVTGEGGDIIIVDDPNAANEIESEATIESVLEWWDGTMPTRRNDPKRSAVIVIQQRLGEQDLTGHILEKSVGEWTHLCLPMRFERDRAIVTAVGWEDPRTEEGELLWPERFGFEEIVTLERSLGPWRSAGQLQQRPEPKGGGIIKRDWWRLWELPHLPPREFVLASLDTAYTEKQENDFSAMSVWGVFSDMEAATALQPKAIRRDGILEEVRRADRRRAEQHPGVLLMDAWQERLEINALVNKVAATCRRHKVDKLLIENKAAGISVAQELRRLFANEQFTVQLVDPRSADKVARLYAVQPLFAPAMDMTGNAILWPVGHPLEGQPRSPGCVWAPNTMWAEAVISQVASFPKGKHDDLVDSTSQALNHLRMLGMLKRNEEWAAEIEAGTQYQGRPPPPIYPV